MRKSLIALLFFCCGVLLGQAPGTGTYNFGSFDSPGFESVNIGNLNVHFSIPIVSRTGRGLPFQYNLVYDGLIWNPSSAGGVSGWTPDPTWGFHGQINNGAGLKGYMTYRTTSVSCVNTDRPSTHIPPTYRVSNFNYYDEFGRRHAFKYTFQPACPAGTPDNDVETGDGSSSDGSGYSLNTGDYSQVLTRSGQSMTVPINPTGQNTMSITDPNGNSINGNGTGGFTDTLGVNALTINGSNPRTFTYPVTLQANNATTATATLFYQTYTVQTNFGCGIPDYPATATSLPSQLTLADGSTYQFSYEATPSYSGNVTGRLASITLPTGGTIQYAYTSGCSAAGGINADGTVGILTRTTTDGVRHYNRTPNNSNSTYTDLIDEKGNDTRYTFSIDAGTGEFLETHRQAYQGSTSGTLLQDRSTCYNGAATSCDGATVALPISSTQVVERFNGGSQSLTSNTYDNNGTLLTDSKVANASGAVQSEVQNVYNSQGLLTSSSSLDGSGTQYALTTYGYDESAVQASSGVPQHGYSPNQTRGNLTSTHVSYASAATLNSTTTYWDTGQPMNTTSADGGITTYGYDSTQGFVTSTALPAPTSGVSLSTSAAFDPNTAAALSTTGMSGDRTTINQYDNRMRLASVTLPSGGTALIAYSSANNVSVTQALDSSRTASMNSLYDGYGRLSRTAVANGQATNPFYQVDYCYDSTGLLQFQSARYQSTGFNAAARCSGTGTTYVYDALGRTTSTTTNDGTKNETVTTAYSNRAVQTTDTNGVSRITQYDLLGRVSSVCEIASSSYGGQAPVACGTDIAGTGFVTSYGYSLANHSTTIAQGAQVRTFTTDWAGRPSSTTEPERGVTSYSYAFNGYGLQVTRTRNKANQPNSNVKTNTTTQYDKLNRLISVDYDDGLTPTKLFYYDVNPSGNGWATPANVVGRLVVATTSANANAAPNTSIQYSYDVAGNVVNVAQCAPSICGTSAQQSRRLQYTYDYSGAVMTATDSGSGVIGYTRSLAGEVTAVTNQSISNTTNPGSLVSGVVNGPFGPTSWNLGNGLIGTKAYDSLGRTTADFLCSGSSTVWCPGGSTVYGNAIQWKASQVTQICDGTFGAYCRNTSYDEFNRLTALTSSEGSNTYAYDRYGNHVATNGVSYSFNPATNQQVNDGYDAAGNQENDGSHSYTYDAEGKIITVDGGTDVYTYDALDHRVRVTTQPGTGEFLFDPFGRRVSAWDASVNQNAEARIYWDGDLLAHRGYQGQTYFHHLNYLGTERVRTNYQGQITSTAASGPFGENLQLQQNSLGFVADDSNQYTSQEHDSESGTDHFQYRQYSEGSGRWMSPDPYGGSYDDADPQTFNRYAYVGNSPLAFTDPLGLFARGDDPGGNFCDFFPDACFVGEGGAGGEANPTDGGGGAGEENIVPDAGRRRQLNPEGQECKELAKKIANIAADIQSSSDELARNPRTLPIDPPYPGAPPRASVQGHQGLLDKKIQNLANRANEYNQKCGGGNPFGGGAAALAPSAAPSSSPTISPGVKRVIVVVGGTIIVGGVVVFCPECLALSPALAF